MVSAQRTISSHGCFHCTAPHLDAHGGTHQDVSTTSKGWKMSYVCITRVMVTRLQGLALSFVSGSMDIRDARPWGCCSEADALTRASSRLHSPFGTRKDVLQRLHRSLQRTRIACESLKTHLRAPPHSPGA